MRLLFIVKEVIVEYLVTCGGLNLATNSIAGDVILVDLVIIGEIEPDSRIVISLYHVVANGVLAAGEKRYAVLVVQRQVILYNLIQVRAIQEYPAVFIAKKAVARDLIFKGLHEAHAEAFRYIVVQDLDVLGVVEEDGIAGNGCILHGDIVAVGEGKVSKSLILNLLAGLAK